MDYPQLIKTIRGKLLITQTELAEMLGCTFASVNRWERGHHEPTIKMKRKIVELCRKNKIKVDL